MPISLTIPTATELKPRILVFGVGGAGGNAVNNMINAQLEGVEFVVANTDAQALTLSATDNRLQLGVSMTQGLGAGSRPDIGRGSAEEAIDQITQQLEGCHMCFITAGMGGGTGTGAGPVVARAAREMGILTVGVVTKPFQFEGAHRMAIAEGGIDEMQQYVDTLIVIPNQNLFRIANEKTTFADAFKMADDVLHMGVRGVTDLMVMPGLINLDFADVRTVMSEMGKAMMGTGEAGGEDRAIQAAEAAISNPLLDDISLKGARGVLINITGGSDLTLFEVDEAANKIRNEVDADANIIVGSTFDDGLDGAMRVSVVATGIDAEEAVRDRPVAVPATPFTRPLSVEPERPAEPELEPEIEYEEEVAAYEEPVAEPLAFPQTSEPQPAAAYSVGNTAVAVAEPVAEPAPVVAQAAPVQQPAVAQQPTVAQQPMQQAAHRDAPFIAPPPARPEVRRDPIRARDPFQDAELTRSQPAAAQPEAAYQETVQPEAGEPPRREASLFERITGTGRARPVGATEAAQPAPTAPQRQSPAAVSSPMPTQRPAAPATDDAAAERQTVKTERMDRLVTPQSEDQNLDIPAFLRRQAN